MLLNSQEANFPAANANPLLHPVSEPHMIFDRRALSLASARRMSSPAHTPPAEMTIKTMPLFFIAANYSRPKNPLVSLQRFTGRVTRSDSCSAHDCFETSVVDAIHQNNTDFSPFVIIQDDPSGNSF
jgi:hypothetical protein